MAVKNISNQLLIQLTKKYILKNKDLVYDAQTDDDDDANDKTSNNTSDDQTDEPARKRRKLNCSKAAKEKEKEKEQESKFDGMTDPVAAKWRHGQVRLSPQFEQAEAFLSRIILDHKESWKDHAN